MEISRRHALAASGKQLLLVTLAGLAAWLGVLTWSLLQAAGLATQWDDPEHWLSLDLQTFWFALIANLALLLLVAFFARVLLRRPWGRDLTWAGQGWQETDAAAAWSAFAASGEPPLTEAPGRVRAVAIVSVPSLMLLTSFAYSLLTVLFGEEPGLDAWLLLLLPCAGVLVHLLATWLQMKTRSVEVSAGGLVDSNFFCTLRVPWSGIAGVQRFGRDAALHENFLSERSGRHRPAERKMWVVMGTQPGQEILRLGDDMVPAQTLVQLRARLGAGPAGHAAVPPQLRPAVQALRAAQADAPDPFLAHQKAFEQQGGRQSGHRLGMFVGMVLLMAPFVLGTLFMCYRSLWFQHAAARTEGTVVEVMADSLPSLRVEYRTPQGKVFVTESDGSDAYAAISVGDRVTVFYDPADPQVVRLDFFLEHWLLPMMLGGLTLILLAVVIVIARTLRPPDSQRR